jgi:ABC-type glycerol-3-phosphate transport system substrate-binding protein
VVYAEGPDDTGTLQKLLDGFNKKYEGQYKVKYREMPADTGSYFNKLLTQLQAGKSDIDVIAGDVNGRPSSPPTAGSWISSIASPRDCGRGSYRATWHPTSTTGRSGASPS